MEKVLNLKVYGKEITTEKNKFCVYSTKAKDGYISVRFTQDSKLSPGKGVHKIVCDVEDCNLKSEKKYDKLYTILYIKKGEIAEFTEEEKELMKEEQQNKILNLLG